MTERTKERLEMILMFALRVQKKMKDESLKTFLADEDKQDAVLYRLGQIGEIASNIPIDEREKYPALPLRQMIGLRHRLFHDYGEVDLTQVYEIAQQPINGLISELNAILSNH